MKIALLSSFYPYRGGIAQFNASLLAELGRRHEVRAYNFKRQYPGLLFPGKTQRVGEDDDAAARVESVALLDTANPLTYRKTAKAIRDWGADLLLMKYWMSYFAPSLGYAARHAGCKAVAILDNVLPHERRFFDKALTKHFLGGCSGFVTMSDTVTADLLALRPEARHVMLPHPLYTHFGARLPREEAERRLGLKSGMKNLLFFGLIREYKGLDILLEAFGALPEDYQLIVAGEPYGSFAPYQALIDRSPGRDRIHLFLNYIRDADVKYYFSAADVTVLPYRSATQSGIGSVSCHFEVPMIVTGTGGLPRTVGDRGTGLVAAAPAPDAIRTEILRYFSDPALREDCLRHIRDEKERLSWEKFCEGLLDFAETVRTDF